MEFHCKVQFVPLSFLAPRGLFPRSTRDETRSIHHSSILSKAGDSFAAFAIKTGLLGTTYMSQKTFLGQDNFLLLPESALCSLKRVVPNDRVWNRHLWFYPRRFLKFSRAVNTISRKEFPCKNERFKL